MKKHKIFILLVVCFFLNSFLNPTSLLLGNTGQTGILPTEDKSASQIKTEKPDVKVRSGNVNPLDFVAETARDQLLEAQAYQGQIQYGLATLEKAIKLYTSIIEKYPNSKYELESHYGIAMAVSEDRDPNIVTESDYELARKHYQEIIRKWPDVVTDHTIHARFQAYWRTPEFEHSRFELYKWLITLTTKQKIDSTRNYSFSTTEISEDIAKSIVDNYLKGWIDTYIKTLEKTISLVDGEMPFGQDVNGLRCRWVRPDVTVKIGDEVKMIVEVENCSSGVISWYCGSQQTLGISKFDSNNQTMYAFDIEKGDGVESEGDVYRMQPGSRIKLVCKSPWKIEAVGLNKLSCTVLRYRWWPSIGYTNNDLMYCLPLTYIVEYKTFSELSNGVERWLQFNK